MRVGEMVDMTVDDIDLDNGVVQVQTAGKPTRLLQFAGMGLSYTPAVS